MPNKIRLTHSLDQHHQFIGSSTTLAHKKTGPYGSTSDYPLANNEILNHRRCLFLLGRKRVRAACKFSTNMALSPLHPENGRLSKVGDLLRPTLLYPIILMVIRHRDALVSSGHRAKASLRWKIIRAAGTSASQASIMRRRVDCKLVE